MRTPRENACWQPDQRGLRRTKVSNNLALDFQPPEAEKTHSVVFVAALGKDHTNISGNVKNGKSQVEVRIGNSALEKDWLLFTEIRHTPRSAFLNPGHSLFPAQDVWQSLEPSLLVPSWGW